MGYSKKILFTMPLLFCAFLFGGCYTKLASYQNETMAANGGGGCSDCGDEAPVNNRREVCVWERDIFGFPEMRCYTTNYSSSWMYFHSTPWWYRSNYRWYDSRGCPPHYYYDRGSGICRYYGQSTYPSGGGGGGGGGSVAGKAPSRPTSRVITSGDKPEPVVEPAPVTSGSVSLPSGPPMFSGGGAGKQLSPVNTPPPAANNSGMSKEPEKQPPPSPPPAEKPNSEQPKQPPSRPSKPSSRGM